MRRIIISIFLVLALAWSADAGIVVAKKKSGGGGGTWGPTAIAATADDGDEYGGSWSTTGGILSNLLLLGDTGSSGNLGFRFPNVTVPQGRTITSATLVIYNTGDENSGEPSGIARVYAWAHDSAPQYSGSDTPSSVTKTTAYATLNALGSAGNVSTTVTTVVQEIINRAGWASGNAINFAIIENCASGNWVSIEDYSNAGTHHATLEIVYE